MGNFSSFSYFYYAYSCVARIPIDFDATSAALKTLFGVHKHPSPKGH